jgi:hypothetical protein
MGEKRNACRILVRKPEGKRPLGRLRHGWVDNIKLVLRERERERERERGCGGRDCIDVTQDTDQCRALVNTVMNLRVP